MVFTCHDGENRLVAAAIGYRWRDTLYSRSVGLDYTRTHGSFAYFNLLVYKAIEYASRNGLNRLQLGLASPAKVERGAVVRPLWMAMVSDGDPGLWLCGEQAKRNWLEPYRRYSHAFPEGAWNDIVEQSLAIPGKERRGR